MGKSIQSGWLFVCILCVAVFSGCSFDPGVASGRDLMVVQNSDMFRREAEKFINNAKVGDVDDMVRQTSDLTIKNEGEAKVRDIYKNTVVPAFRGRNVVWDDGFSRDYDSNNNNMGLVFSGRVTNGDAFGFSIWVFGESGEVVIVTIRKH